MEESALQGKANVWWGWRRESKKQSPEDDVLLRCLLLGLFLVDGTCIREETGIEACPAQATTPPRLAIFPLTHLPPPLQGKAEVLALAKRMLRRKEKESIIDAAYSRYANHDVGLPRWFEEDELRHRRCVLGRGEGGVIQAQRL